ncbi:DUF4192 family protein [Microbacterium sp. NPDC055910]|uniref:DUF4192 family protein n=1 Tax=Microbacterium sp. NPDC055910 TaxID=3345659 RepID=UPI0035E23495
MTTIVKAANAAEFLSFVPRMLGFVPQLSLVVVPFARSRTLGAMRFDLPHGDEDVDRIAATVIGMACRVALADAVALVVYTDADVGRLVPLTALPHDGLVAALAGRADACGLRLVDALCVAADAWCPYLDGDAHPRDLAELDLSDAVAPGDQSSGAELPAVADGEREAVDAAVGAFSRAVEVLCGPDAAGGPDSAASGDADARVDPQALAAVCAIDDLPGLFEDVLDWDAAALAPYRVATLAWCLSRPALRDIALVQWCRGPSAGDEALDAQLRWEDGEEYPAHLAMMMWGEGERPDPARLSRALDVVRRVAATAPLHDRPGALATAAWLSWALGHSTHADRYARGATDIEPEHGLAEIVLSFVGMGHLPDWAFRRTLP